MNGALVVCLAVCLSACTLPNRKRFEEDQKKWEADRQAWEVRNEREKQMREQDWPRWDAQAKTMDLGPAPTEKQVMYVVNAYIKPRLKDPDSMKLGKVVPAQKSWFTQRADPLTPTFGWVVLVEINAKNSYGGYTGFKVWRIFFYDRNKSVTPFEPDSSTRARTLPSDWTPPEEEAKATEDATG